jgi:allantoicase
MSMFDDLRRHFVNLAQPRLGAEVTHATDDFFADKARLIDPAEPRFIDDKYDEHGKWMDGWESRRRRTPGHDWCVVRLGVPGRVAGVEIDTRHFTGNYPPEAEVHVCRSGEAVPGEEAGWTRVTGRLALKGDDRVYVPVEHDEPVTHVRLDIFPDGGVARLRVWGRVARDWPAVDPDARLDLLAMENGGRGIIASDEHYGRIENLTAPGRGANMGDGWETRRRREAGHDWAVLELGAPGRIDEVVIDTAHFKGNYPDRCFLQAAAQAPGSPEEIAAASEGWPLLLPEVKLEADRTHVFRDQLADPGPVRFVRLNIVPDGGVSRLRLVGRVSR